MSIRYRVYNFIKFFSFFYIFLFSNFCVFSSTNHPDNVFVLGFEFQESNHLFNQGDDTNPLLISDELIKIPLLKVKYKGKEIFHVEIDDYDLEIVTVPFLSDEREIQFFEESFRHVQNFISKIYDFMESQETIKTFSKFINFLESDSHDTNLEYEVNKDLNISTEIKLHKSQNFVPSFKSQFSVQTTLSNFIISYLFLFYTNNNRIQSTEMKTIRETLSGANLTVENYDLISHNFIALFLYTCISPKIVSDAISMGSGMLSDMLKSQQCDYKMYLPLMSRVPFSLLIPDLNVLDEMRDWSSFSEIGNIGGYDFGDFYNPVITEKLIKYLSKHIPQSDQNLFRMALKNGIMTTRILKMLNEKAFSSNYPKSKITEYINSYGNLVYLSIKEKNNKKLQLNLKLEGDSSSIEFEEIDVTRDLFSPPFLCQKENSMGTFDETQLYKNYGNFLFEVRAANKLGKFIKCKLRGLGVERSQDFLKLPQNIEKDAIALLKVFNLLYNGDTVKLELLKEFAV